MTQSPKKKKIYFKKEKKSMQPKRHKAPSANAKSVKEKGSVVKQPQTLQFPNIFRFIPEGLGKIRFFQIARSAKLPEKPGEKKQSTPIKKVSPSYTFMYSHQFWMTGLLSVSLIFVGFLGWESWQEYSVWHTVKSEHMQLEKDLETWEEMTQKYPTYRDAYFEAAVISYRLGNIQKEQEFLQKLQQIDPNFTLTQKLQEISKE